MCGIAGYIAPDPVTTDAMRSRLQKAAESMVLRGPDDEGFFFSQRVGVAHRRLAILDLEGGHQPFIDSASGAVLVYNGEIYNYRELKTELEAAGCRFQTHSDTEVLLQAFLTWGKDCLSRFIGMFAFAIYTPGDGSLFMARDRLGVKPLFWSEQRKTHYFASTMRALLDLLPDRPALDIDAISHYLSTIRINLGENTLLDGIRLLSPGHWIRITAEGQRQTGCYWSAPCLAPGEKPERSLASAAEELRALMQDAVRLRLISDVPLGGFLSGGLDSTIIASLATTLTSNHYHAYNVGYPNQGYNEFPFVDEAAAAYTMRCRQIVLDEADYPAMWQQLVRQNALPLTTPNEVPIQVLARALRQEYTVALSGEGADEVFGGYTIPYFAANDFDRASRTPLANAPCRAADEAIRRGYGQDYLPDLATQHILLNAWLTPSEKSAWVHPELTNKLNNDAAMRSFYCDLYDSHPQCSTLDRVMLAHLRVNLEGLLLRVDSSTMAASVEARVPFTDHRLVEFAFSLPDAFRLDWRSPEARAAGTGLNTLEVSARDLLESKRILRLAFADTVPASILNRPKMSFPVPVFDWMQNGLAPMIRGIIADSPLRHSLFNPLVIEAWLDGQVNIHPAKLWPIVNLCLWDACR